MTTAQQAPSVPAGWFADPGNGPFDRWWNGEVWTEHSRPHEVAFQPPAPPYALQPAAAVDDGSNGLIVAGYVLAVLMPIIGLILGIIATTRPVKRISKQGVGIIVVSCVAFVVWLAIFSAGASTTTY